MSPRRARPQPKPTQGGLPSWMIIAAVALIAVVVLFVGYDFISKNTGSPIVAPVTGISTTGRTKGDPNAKVAFLEFSDFQWPYCKDFALGVERQIEANYVKANKVNFTYKYYPVVDQGRVGESHWAAQAAECANQQAKFWEYHDKLFGVWAGENIGTFTKAKLKTYADGIVPDLATFNQCLDSDKTASVVDADVAEATRLGVQGTPTFFVNNRLLNIQSLDYGSFSRTFDSLLK